VKREPIVLTADFSEALTLLMDENNLDIQTLAIEIYHCTGKPLRSLIGGITKWLQDSYDPSYPNLLGVAEACGYDLVLVPKKGR
jgi:hypothetical protein